jgi:hypothetical protein
MNVCLEKLGRGSMRNIKQLGKNNGEVKARLKKPMLEKGVAIQNF